MERKAIVAEFNVQLLTPNQQKRAYRESSVCRHQRGICVYSDLDGDEARCITERMAMEGKEVEIDHIVPISRSQDNGLNNKVLVFREANRNKGNRTPKECLSPQEYERLCQRFRFWQETTPRKWEDLTCDAPDRGTWLSSQLTDTAYAATQVEATCKRRFSAIRMTESDGIFYQGQPHRNPPQRLAVTRCRCP